MWRGGDWLCHRGAGTPGGQKRPLDPPGDGVPGSPELPNVGAGTQTRILWKIINALAHRTIPTALIQFPLNCLLFS